MSLEFNLEKTARFNFLKLSGKILSEGELDEVKKLIYPMDNVKGTNWILDLSELTHTNSTGISFMVKLLTRARVNDGELVLSGVKGTVATLFKIAKIDLIFTIFNTPSEAKEFFTAKA
jgi:anti-sigma B factor antagonist